MSVAPTPVTAHAWSDVARVLDRHLAAFVARAAIASLALGWAWFDSPGEMARQPDTMLAFALVQLAASCGLAATTVAFARRAPVGRRAAAIASAAMAIEVVLEAWLLVDVACGESAFRPVLLAISGGALLTAMIMMTWALRAACVEVGDRRATASSADVMAMLGILVGLGVVMVLILIAWLAITAFILTAFSILAMCVVSVVCYAVFVGRTRAAVRHAGTEVPRAIVA